MDCESVAHRGIPLGRILATTSLSVVLVPICWVVTKLESAGLFTADCLVPYGPTPNFDRIPEVFGLGAAIDFLLCFAGLWGAWSLWKLFPESKGAYCGAALCTFSVAFYPATLYANHG